jgi:hypothetical protein
MSKHSLPQLAIPNAGGAKDGDALTQTRRRGFMRSGTHCEVHDIGGIQGIGQRAGL